MAIRLPEGLRKVLDDDTKFLKRDIPVVDRLRNPKDIKEIYGEKASFYASAMKKIDGIISEYNPLNEYTGESVFDDPYLCQWMGFCSLLVRCSSVYSQEKADEIRNDRKIFAKKLKDISKDAAKLAKAMRGAYNLGNKYGFIENVDFNPLGLLQSTVTNQADALTRNSYNDHAAEKIEDAMVDISGDLVRLPTIFQMLDELSRQYAQEFEQLGMALVLKSTSKVNDFCTQFFTVLKHDVEMCEFSPKVLEERVITKTDWASIFSVSLGYDVTDQNIKDFGRHP